ncbi:TAXI family TRAP transporter solute-binding subunit [Azospirillum sp. sgz302134]
MKTLFLIAGLASAAMLVTAEAQSASQSQSRHVVTEAEPSLTERMNANTVAVISGTPGGTYFRMASEMAFVLDNGDDLRVLPVLGKGAGQNAYDVRFLKGIDLGFVRTDTMDQLRQDPRLRNIENQLVYVARLFNDELHVIAARGITDYRQLEGKKVSFDVAGSGTDSSGRMMFDGLGIKVEPVNVDQPTAINMLKAGEIAAMVSVAAKPVAVVASISDEGLHFLDIPYADPLMKNYFPAALSSEDYPKLVKPGETVSTIAVGTILATYNWPERTDRYRRIARFIDAFFSKIEEFQKPQRHPKWREVNLEATVGGGWKRFKAAEDWLNGHREPQQPALTAEMRESLKTFVQQRTPGLKPSERDRLVEDFIRWRESQPQ